MTREEILKELHYHGKYTIDVKKRLRKLLKKYHPDKNKKDNQTILILYEIKKELENGTLQYQETNEWIKKEKNLQEVSKDFHSASMHYLYFLENMVEKLKKQKATISKKIKDLYRKWNKIIDKKNQKQEELGKTSFKMNELEEDMNNILKINKKEKWITTSIIILLFLSLIRKKIIFVLISIGLIVIEIYNIHRKYQEYHQKKNRMKRLSKKRKIIQEEYMEIENQSMKLDEREKKLKREERRINNDIQFYSNEISKVKEQVTQKEQEKEITNKEEKLYHK